MARPTQRDIEALLPSVQGLVFGSFSRIPEFVATRDDLVQVAMEAICRVAPRWREDGGASFKTFALIRARGAVVDHLRSVGGRYEYQRLDVTSLDAPIAASEDGETLTLGDTIAVYDDYVDPFVVSAIDEAVASCSLDAQSAFRLHYDEDMPLIEVGELMGVTESRVSQLCGYCRDAIAAHPAIEVRRNERTAALAA